MANDVEKQVVRPLRVAYLDHSGEMGGAEHLLLTLMKGISREAVLPFLVCSENGPFPQEAVRVGIETRIIALPALHSLSIVVGQHKLVNPMAVVRNLVGIIISAWRIRLLVQSLKVDLIQTNSAFAHIYGGLAARWMGMPCVWNFHDLVETRRFAGATTLVWRTLAGLLAARVVGDSEAVVRALSIGSRGLAIYPGYQERGADNSIDLRDLFRLPVDSKLVGYVGRIAYVKGLDVLVEAAHQVVKAEPRCHFLVFGEALFGEVGYKRQVAKMVDRWQLYKNWHWVGYDSAVAGRIPGLDLLVLPSRRESFGLVLLEAAVASKAAVVTRVGGIPEIIVDGETGIVVTPEAPLELASAILKLIQSPELAEQMGRRANQRVKRYFTSERYFTQYLRLYDSLINHGTKPNFVRS